jgi:hypothetical protein
MCFVKIPMTPSLHLINHTILTVEIIPVISLSEATFSLSLRGFSYEEFI